MPEEQSRPGGQTADSPLFQLAFHANPAASTITTLPDETFVDVNPAFLELTGYEREQVLGHRSADLDLWVNRARRAQIGRAIGRGEIVRDVEGQMRTRDGTIRYVLAAFAPVQLEGHNAILSVFYDITDRKRRERHDQLMSTLATTLRDLEQPAAIASSVLSHLLQLFAADGATVLLYHLEREQTLLAESAGPAAAVVHAAAAAAIRQQREPGLAARDRLLIHPLPLQPPLAGAIGLHRQPALPPLEDEFLLQAVADALAATLRRAYLRQAQRRQMQRLQQIMELAPAALILLDEQRRIKMLNHRAHDHLPLLAGKGPGDVLEQVGEIPLSHLLARPGDPHEIHTGTGQIFIALAESLSSEDGENLLVLHDVTEEHRADAYRKEQERLTAVGKLAAGMAHEVNNSLTAIGLNVQLLLHKGSVLPADRPYLHDVEAATGRAAALIQQMLDFGRRAVLNRQPLALETALARWAPALRPLLPPTAHLSLAVEPDPDPYLVSADPDRLQRLLHNLVANAGEALAGAGTVHLRLRRHTFSPHTAPPFPGMAAGPWVILAVEDDGQGIAPQDLPHVFEPFFTTKGAHSASGMGLAQAYGIVKQHDGYIDVVSRPDEGTTVSVYLPPVTEQPRPPAPKPPPDARHTILLVEDTEATRRALADTLELLGYRVLTAASGEEAFQSFRQQRDEIAVVLSDLVMPGRLDGLELCQAIHHLAPDVKVLLMTGHPLGQESRVVADQVAGWLQKPFGIDKLEDALEQVLGSAE